MFSSPHARFALRVVVVSAIAGFGLLKTYIGDGLSAQEVVDVLGTTLGAGAAYAGIGAVSKSVEPKIGRTKE